ncbi:MAG: ABC-type multidrug transport system, permease component, partial [Phenylobacterium sp.]|nr:ABC-type multidrug transport system, permease component [Phenylobacterium sp.]
VYLISGFRWAFYGVSDVGVGLSLSMTLAFLAACMIAVTVIFRTGWKLKT